MRAPAARARHQRQEAPGTPGQGPHARRVAMQLVARGPGVLGEPEEQRRVAGAEDPVLETAATRVPLPERFLDERPVPTCYPRPSSIEENIAAPQAGKML